METQTQKTKLNWKNILIGIIIGVIIVGVIGFSFWYFTRPKAHPQEESNIALCDINADRKCDVADLNLLNKALGTSRGQKGYVPLADLNADGVINDVDKQMLLKLFDQNQNDETANEKIIYSYGYAPLNPKDVQVTTITVENGEVTKTVADGSGNIKSNNYYSISSNQFNGIVEGIKKYNISSKEMDVNKGCTGGSTRTLQILENDDEEVLHGEVYSCGGKDFTNISGDFEKIFAEIEGLVP